MSLFFFYRIILSNILMNIKEIQYKYEYIYDKNVYLYLTYISYLIRLIVKLILISIQSNTVLLKQHLTFQYKFTFLHA